MFSPCFTPYHSPTTTCSPLLSILGCSRASAPFTMEILVFLSLYAALYCPCPFGMAVLSCWLTLLSQRRSTAVLGEWRALTCPFFVLFWIILMLRHVLIGRCPCLNHDVGAGARVCQLCPTEIVTALPSGFASTLSTLTQLNNYVGHGFSVLRWAALLSRHVGNSEFCATSSRRRRRCASGLLAIMIALCLPSAARGQTLATGDYHTCAIVAGGVRCWGRGTQGQVSSCRAHGTKLSSVSTVPSCA
jgi:hypothetical protein